MPKIATSPHRAANPSKLSVAPTALEIERHPVASAQTPAIVTTEQITFRNHMGEPREHGATLPQPDPSRNPQEHAAMADHPTTLDHAEGMLDYLRGLDPAEAHEMARAAIGASMAFLCERFGDVHAFEVADGLASCIVAEWALLRCQPPSVALH